MQVTHARHWKKFPSSVGTFVSKDVQHAYPILDKRKDIRKVLDVACGNGMGVTMPLLRRGLRVTCTDHLQAALSAVQLNAAREGYSVHTKKADMYGKLPFARSSFDATFCFQAIYHGRIEQIMHTFSEIARVTKKNGYFFATLLPFEAIRMDGKRPYIPVLLENGKTIKSYHKVDETEPHLHYYLTKDFEYMEPHYYFSKDELRAVLSQYFSDVTIKKAVRPRDKFFFWFVACKV